MVLKKYIFLIIILSFSILVKAEVKPGRIAGKIVSKLSQKAVPSVNITIDEKVMGLSDSKGKYLIENIAAGTHTIKFSRIGFSSDVRSNIVVKPNQTLVINAQLIPTAITMDKVTVSGKNYFSKQPEAPVSSKNLDIDEIKTQPSGVYDVQRSIQALPAIVGGTDTSNEIIVRGGNYGENLFVMDNIELANPNHFAWPGTGGGPVSIISSEFVDNVDFYAGTFPGRYGNKASSVLDITTRDGANYFKSKLDIGMAGYGATLEGPIKKNKSAYLLSYHRSFLSLVKHSFGLTAVPNYHSIFGKETFYLDGNSKITINQVWAKDWIYIKHNSDNNVAQTAGLDKYDVDAKSGQYTLGATYKKILTKSYYLLTAYNNSNWWNQKVNNAFADGKLSFSYKFYEYLNGLKFSYFMPETKLGNFEMGTSLKYDFTNMDIYAEPDTFFIYDANAVIIDTLRDENGNIVVNKIGEDDKNKNNVSSLKIAGYIQLEKKFSFLTITSNIRYDYMKYNRSGVVSPRLMAQMPLGNNANINFGIGRNFQNPTYETFNKNTENKYLKPKYANQVVLGTDYLFAEDVKLIVESYYKNYRDVPVSYAFITPDSTDRSPLLVNKGKGYAKGIELFLQKKVKNNFWGTLSYSYSIAQAYDPRDTTDNTLYDWDFDYRNVFTGIIGNKIEFMKYDWYENYRKIFLPISWLIPFLSDETEITFKFRYMGGKPYTEKEYSPYLRKWFTPTNKPLNNARFAAYKKFDVLILRRWFENKFNITTYLEVENILDTKNVWDYNYLEDGSKETVYQMGRMIVGGFILEF